METASSKGSILWWASESVGLYRRESSLGVDLENGMAAGVTEKNAWTSGADQECLHCLLSKTVLERHSLQFQYLGTGQRCTLVREENISKVVQSRPEENSGVESAEAGPVCGRSSDSDGPRV